MLFGLITPKYKQESQWVFDSALARAKAMFPETFTKDSITKEDRDSKFEAISVYMALYVRTLLQMETNPKASHKLLQRVYEEMYDRYDIALREQGVGDVKVGPTVRALAAKFKTRLEKYTAAYQNNASKDIVEVLVEFGLCSKMQAMQLSIRLCAEAKLMQNLSLEQWLQHIKNPTVGAYEPHEMKMTEKTEADDDNQELR